MKSNAKRILAIHARSPSRLQGLVDVLFAQDRGEPVDQALFDSTMRRVHPVNDGETRKIGHATYIRHRLTNFEGDFSRPARGPI